MKAFSLYFLLNRRRFTTIIAYTVLMIFLMQTMIRSAGNDEAGFTIVPYTLYIQDMDQSELSEGLTEYLLDGNEKYDGEFEDDTEITDAINAESINYAIRIPENYQERLLAGEDVKLETVASFDEYTNITIDNQIANFLNLFNQYASFMEDADLSEVIANVQENLEESVEIDVLAEHSNLAMAKMQAYFGLSDYFLIAILFVIIGGSFEELEDKKVKGRDLISGYSPFRRSLGVFLAALVSGVLVWLVLLAQLPLTVDLATIDNEFIILAIASSASHMLAITGMVFMISNIFSGKGSNNFFSTIFSLIIAFSTGLFIPKQFIFEGLYRASAIFPTYWDMQNQELISGAAALGVDYSLYARNILVILLMTVVYFIVAFIVYSTKSSRAQA